MAHKAASAGSKYQSDWMLQGPGENIFRLAKERVYRVVSSGGNTRLKHVFEDKPKEILLHQVLTEIENRWKSKEQEGKNDGDESSPAIPSSANVLLVVKDERALRSVHSYLSNPGGKGEMKLGFLNYLQQVREKVKPMLRPGGHDLSSLPTEQRLLCEEHSRVKNSLFGPDGMNQQVREEDKKKLSDWKRKHRKMTEERTRGMVTADAIRQQAHLEEAVEVSIGGMNADSMFQRIDTGNEYSDDGSGDSWSSEDEEGPELGYKVEPIEGHLNLFIRTFSKLAEGEATNLLHDLRPEYVVMYDSDPSFIRSLEIYSNSMKSHNDAPLAEEDRLQVSFLLYEASADDTTFLRSLDRERVAFDKLIEHKKRMPTSLPTFNNFSTQEMQQARGGAGGSYAGGTLPLSVSSYILLNNIYICNST